MRLPKGAQVTPLDGFMLASSEKAFENPPATQKALRAAMPCDFSVRFQDGEIRIAPRGFSNSRAEDMAYHTNDLQDALLTAISESWALLANRVQYPERVPAFWDLAGMVRA